MLNWNTPTSRPRHFAGAISAMYIGPSTEEPPTPSPPINRNTSSASQFHAIPHPTAEIKYKIAIARRLSRRPLRSPGTPASDAPKIVPSSAIETVKPRPHSDSAKVFFNPAVVPEITAVSKPNSSPPSAATTVLLISVAVSLTPAPPCLPDRSKPSPLAPALPIPPPGSPTAAAEYIHPTRPICRGAVHIRSAAPRILPVSAQTNAAAASRPRPAKIGAAIMQTSGSPIPALCSAPPVAMPDDPPAAPAPACPTAPASPARPPAPRNSPRDTDSSPDMNPEYRAESANAPSPDAPAHAPRARPPAPPRQFPCRS